MLDYKRIKRFFDKYPYGTIVIVQVDEKFELTKNVSYTLDRNSIFLKGIYFNRNVYGNNYVRKGDFMIPFQSIIRVEYLTQDEV